MKREGGKERRDRETVYFGERENFLSSLHHLIIYCVNKERIYIPHKRVFYTLYCK